MWLKKTYAILFLLSAIQLIAKAQQPNLVLPTGHTGIIRVACFSPDGKYVVTGGEDKQVIVWEAHSGKKVHTLGTNISTVTFTSFSKDGRYLAAGTDSAIVIWSFPDYRQLGIFELARRIIFSPDNKKVFVLGYDGNILQCALPSLKTEFEYRDNIKYESDPQRKITRIAISPDGNSFCSISFDSSLIIRNTRNGKITATRKLKGDSWLCFFSADNMYINLVSDRGMERYHTGNESADSMLLRKWIVAAFLSNNGKYLLISWNMPGEVSALWDMEKYKPIFQTDTIYSVNDTLAISDINESSYRTGTAAYGFPRFTGMIGAIETAPSGEFIRIGDRIWNCKDNRLSYLIKDNDINRSDFSPDGRFLLVQQKSGSIGLWDLAAQKKLQVYETKVSTVQTAAISPDGNIFALAGTDRTVSINDLKTGQKLFLLRGHTASVKMVQFSSDSRKLLTNSLDSTACLWDMQTGLLLKKFKGQHPELNPAWFDWKDSVMLPNERIMNIAKIDDNGKEYEVQMPEPLENPENILNTQSNNGKFAFFRIRGYPIWNVGGEDNKLQLESQWTYTSLVHCFSQDSKWLAIAESSGSDSMLVGEIETGKWLFRKKLNTLSNDNWLYGSTEQLHFTKDRKYLLAADAKSVIHIFSTANFMEVAQLPGKRAYLSADDKYLLALNKGNCDIYDFDNRKLLYTYIMVDSTDYLVIDDRQRFDGTEQPRKMLYYSCGNEIVDLEQAKDLLWVPNLAERIMKGDSINAKTLSELNICGLTPEMEDKSTAGQFRFYIKPRRGGLGETVVYVNGIEARRYKPGQLKKQGEVYELILSKTELNNYFIAGKENPVTVKAYTADNAISSRGIIINQDKTQEKITATPNLYAVMVGVSDYKDEELDLKYAAKDANDISAAVAASARKLLNSDGKEHVFVYDLTTSEKRYQLPEKNSIKKVLEEIGKKATANDILLLFFAGHGVMQGEKKQFYFLTADASKTTAASAVADVGISTAELTEWMKPQNIKAQKRILIFDACNSGQAIRDLVKVGNEGQGYMAARSDEQSQQIKAIDKLNEQSGFFILSASASNQSAYEMGRYSQGLLTYSLLKAIKQQPDILADGKYLDVSRWFNAAEKTVTELTKETGARQQPQVISNTNFTIGIVDEEVMAKIVLPQEKPLFAASNFQNNDENIADDDLELSKLINLQLNDMASRGASSKIVYVTATNSPDAYSLTGRYTINNKVISVQVNLKQNKLIKARFELRGTSDKLNELAAAVALKAADLIK